MRLDILRLDILRVDILRLDIDANMDMSFCGDYFGVIVYVTDYCMKDESGVLTFITEALKQDGDGSLGHIFLNFQIPTGLNP